MSWPSFGMRRPVKLAPEIVNVFLSCRGILMSAAVFSGLINLLSLSSSLYMLQVYDRVIPSHSVATLIGLSLGMIVLFSGHGVLDIVRTKLMTRMAIQVDRLLRERVMALVLKLPLRASSAVDAMAPVRDLDQMRSFASSGAPVALFDMPWMPFYLMLVWLLHPWLGILATCGALVLVGLTVLTELRGREPTRDMGASGAQRMVIAETHRRNATAIYAMGMTGRVIHKWDRANEKFLADQTAATDITGTYGSISRVMRLVLQSAVLGLGAYLVIEGQATGGVMIAASILVSRALAPIEIVIANWRGFLAARQSVTRLSDLFRADPEWPKPLPLPKPTQALEVDAVWVAPPGQQQPVVINATFTLKSGSALGIVGPSASGKSSLVRCLIGAWPLMRGSVRLDGATLDQWAPDDLGVHIGYLPQEVELIEGTVAENISRFEPYAPPEAVIEAARQAGVHDMIVRLPKGYETPIGEFGASLSAGQRQRVALARALYRDPFMVVLDEPNSNLDNEGELALTNAITNVRNRGGVVVVVAHRQSALTGCDYLMVMTPGHAPVFGTKDEIQRKLTATQIEQQQRPEPAPPSQPAPAPASVQRPTLMFPATAESTAGQTAAQTQPSTTPPLAAAPPSGQPPVQPVKPAGGVRLRIITEGS